MFDVRTQHEHRKPNIEKQISNIENRMAKQQQQEEENQINVELSEDMAEGEYVNLAMIAHSQSEFVIDFIKMMPGVPKAKVKARIVLTPQHAKRLVKALNDNVQRFEQVHGKIKDSDVNALPLSFGGPTAQA